MDGSLSCEDTTGVVGKTVEEIVSGAGEGERGDTEADPMVAHPLRAGRDSLADGGSVVTDDMLAQPPFLEPVGLEPVGLDSAGAKVAVVDVVNGFAIRTPAAAAILRSSFSSRFRSFSLRLSCSSGVFCFARWLFCISRKRILWWCAYEFVCSSY